MGFKELWNVTKLYQSEYICQWMIKFKNESMLNEELED